MKLLYYTLLIIILMNITNNLYANSLKDNTKNNPYELLGTGTEEDPYLISNAIHFSFLNDFLGEANKDKYFKLTNDINLNVNPYDQYCGFFPIGTMYNSFYGHLDGNNKRIFGMRISKEELLSFPYSNDAALFISLNGAVIHNLYITDINITCRGNAAGFVVYNYNNSLIEECAIVKGNIRGYSVGGISWNNRNSIIKNSYATCNLVSTTSGGSGGITFINEVSDFNPKMIYVEGGTFNNGVSDITLSPFYIGNYEVNRFECFNQVLINWTYRTNYAFGDEWPVFNISWGLAIDYCNTRSINDGLEPCYTYEGYGQYPYEWPPEWREDSSYYNNITCNFNANGYRLPTEAEWEFASRGGNLSMNYTYSGSDSLYEVSTYIPEGELSFPCYKSGLKLPNELGIYDMTGNMAEWCWDWYDDYNTFDQFNPTGPINGNTKVYRGKQGWNNTYRGFGGSIEKYGIRVVRSHL